MTLENLKPIEMNGIRDMVHGLEKAIKNRYGVDLKMTYEDRPDVEIISRNHEAERIKGFTLKYFDVSDLRLCSASRKKDIVIIRQYFLQALKRRTKLSLKEMGLHLGGRDHSTVIHAHTGFNDLFDTDKVYRSAWDEYNKSLDQYLLTYTIESNPEAIPV